MSEILPKRVKAAVTIGYGGYDKLVYGDTDVPVPGPHEVLISVLAAGVNNTDINTRLGWYSSSVTAGTEGFASVQQGEAVATRDGGWNGAAGFPEEGLCRESRSVAAISNVLRAAAQTPGRRIGQTFRPRTNGRAGDG